MDNVHEIVIAGPFAPDFLITLRGREYLLSVNGRAYPTSELARIEKYLKGQRVFYDHVFTEGPSMTTTRVMNGSKGLVGRLAMAMWLPQKRELRAMLEVLSLRWQREFFDPQKRWQYGFSIDVGVTGRIVGGLDITEKIATIRSIDLVDEPAMGGRFIDAPPLTDEALDRKRETFELARQLNMEAE